MDNVKLEKNVLRQMKIGKRHGFLIFISFAIIASLLTNAHKHEEEICKLKERVEKLEQTKEIESGSD